MRGADIAIIGGGPAGLTTGIALLRARPDLADRVVLLEKARYPREKICAGALGERGWRVLESLDAAPNVPHVPISAIRLDTREASIQAGGGLLGRVLRRKEFDAALADRARALGLRIEEGCALESLVENEGSVSIETTSGVLDCAAVVGADGVGSKVRRALGQPVGRLRAMVLEVDTAAAPGDPARDVLRFDATQPDLPGYYWDFPTQVEGEDLWCRGLYLLRVAEGTERGMAPADHIPLKERMAAYLAARGLDLDAVRNKRFAERGWEAPVHPVQGRCLLVGEAIGIDPVTGEGIAQAIECGRDLGRFLARCPLEPAALARWALVHRRSRLGRDLWVRRSLLRPCYGPDRDRLERRLAGNAALLSVGCAHWAGRAPPIGDLLKGLGQVAWRTLTGAPPRQLQ